MSSSRSEKIPQASQNNDMVQIDAKILENREIAPERFRMVLSAPQVAWQARPGQFIHVRVTNGYSPLLRRPFSVHRVESQKIELLYKVVGKGTEILSGKKRGEYLDILGPLGRGYRLPSISSKTSNVVLVGGGTGVVSLMFLAETILLTSPKIPILVLIGAKNIEELLSERDFKGLGCQVRVATENGSKGYKGLVSNLFENWLRHYRATLKPSVFACGPGEMLKRLGEISRRHRFPCQVSLEEHLACGIGACLGCVVKANGSPYTYKRVCKDGPVFDAGELIWE